MLTWTVMLYKIHLMLICSDKPININFKIIFLSWLLKRISDKYEYVLLDTQ